jgi:hypothetical protein
LEISKGSSLREDKWKKRINDCLNHILEKLNSVLAYHEPEVPTLSLVGIIETSDEGFHEVMQRSSKVDPIALKDTVFRNNSRENTRNGLIRAGFKIKARKIWNLRYCRTNFHKIFALIDCVFDPSINHCYICRDISFLNSKNDLVLHFYIYRQLSVVPLLAQAVDGREMTSPTPLRGVASFDW